MLMRGLLAIVLALLALSFAACNSNSAGFNLMDRTITWGDMVTIGAIGVAVAIVGGVVIYFIIAFGRGMSR